MPNGQSQDRTVMKIIRAEHLGMCFGVRDAIALAMKETDSAPLTILGDLVHNETVVSRLRERGINIKHQVDDINTPAVMITAHGDFAADAWRRSQPTARVESPGGDLSAGACGASKCD